MYMASLHLAQEIFNLIYPVGSVYISVNDTNPGTLFGGNWSRITDGYLFCGATGYGKGTQSNLLNATRTADTTLTVNQIPAHSHNYGNRLCVWDASAAGTNAARGSYGETSIQFYGWGSVPNTDNTGGGQGHSHPMPTTAVSVWKRTA